MSRYLNILRTKSADMITENMGIKDDMFQDDDPELFDNYSQKESEQSYVIKSKKDNFLQESQLVDAIGVDELASSKSFSVLSGNTYFKNRQSSLFTQFNFFYPKPQKMVKKDSSEYLPLTIDNNTNFCNYNEFNQLNNQMLNLKKNHFEEKNFHRYITKMVMRALGYKSQKLRVESLCQTYNITYDKMLILSRNHHQKIISLKQLQQELLLVQETDSEEKKAYKTVYREFALWFLQYKAIRIMLKIPKKQRDPQRLNDFIDYKNNKYMNFLLHPERQFTNQDFRLKTNNI